jgi:hypothetical protein
MYRFNSGMGVLASSIQVTNIRVLFGALNENVVVKSCWG